jgi:ABC-type transporter Mla maintaining outer membrane lipid asymmetry ATPase subunit MlaF
VVKLRRRVGMLFQTAAIFDGKLELQELAVWCTLTLGNKILVEISSLDSCQTEAQGGHAPDCSDL